MAKRKSDFGTLYKGHEGQWTWIAHRVTGVAIILFLFAHVVDTAVIGWGPEAYNRVLSVYQNWGVRLLELGLVAAVLFHALNGVRIMIIDFWPSATRYNRQLLYGPTPPLWQSEQLTAVMSPRSTGCLNATEAMGARCAPPSSWSSTVWHELQSLLMALPSLLT